MKYNILINQKAVIDAGFDLDIVDLAIFELLKDFALTDKCQKTLGSDGKTYFLFNWRLVNSQLPILGLNTRQSVFKRFDKLKDCEIIVANSDNMKLGKSLYCFGVNYERMIFRGSDLAIEPVNESLHPLATTVVRPVNESLQLPVNNGLHNNNPSDNIINNNAGEDPGAIVKDKKIKFIELLFGFVQKNPGKYPKRMYYEFVKYWIEEDNELTRKRKNISLRFEKQQFFSMSRRLSTWFQRSSDQIMMEAWKVETSTDPLKSLLKPLL